MMNKMTPFLSHSPSKYNKDEQHLAIYSNWYPTEISFNGKEALKNYPVCQAFHLLVIKKSFIDGDVLRFNNSETLFMYLKAVFFQSDVARILVDLIYAKEKGFKTDTSYCPYIPDKHWNEHMKEVKTLGRSILNFDEKKWSFVSYAMMRIALIAKFKSSTELRNILMLSNDILVEASSHDTIWGIGLSAGSPGAYDADKWLGLNLLGIALMDVRDYFREVL